MRSTRVLQVLSLLGAGTLAACGDSTAPKTASHPVSLSLTTQASTTAAFALAGAPMRIGVTIGDGSLVITKAQLVLRDIKLEGTPTGSATCTARDESQDQDEQHGGDDGASVMMSSQGADDGAGHDANDDSEHRECGELRLGPVLVDLPLDATTQQVATVPLPEGSYREIKLHLHAPVSSSTRDAAFVAANPAFEGASVRLEGTYNGQPFVWTTGINAVMQLEFSPPVVVDASGRNVTLAIDLSRWFVDASGTTIDPATAGAGTTNRAVVESNIRASFHAMHDDDRDGRDDDHGDDDHGQHSGGDA